MRFEGTDISREPAHTRAGRAIGFAPEDRRLIPELTVEENLLLPSWANHHKA